MKNERIELNLYHFVDKDYECKSSLLIANVLFNNKKKEYCFKEISSESLFYLVKDLIENTKNDGSSTEK